MEIFSETVPSDRIEILNCYDETGSSTQKRTRNRRVQESHPEREILFVLAGKSSFLLNGKICTAAPGDVFFINRWVPHQCQYGTIKTDFKHIWFHFHENRLFGVLFQNSVYQRTRVTPTWEHSRHLLEFLSERWDRALLEQEHSVERKEIYLSIARILAEELHYRATHAPDKLPPKKDQLAGWMKDYISIQYGRRASLSELEKLTGYNRFYLMRLFKAEFGMTIGDYINCVRRGYVAAARAQRIPQKEVAQSLGFQSPAAFWLWKHRDSIKQKSKSSKTDVPSAAEPPENA